MSNELSHSEGMVWGFSHGCHAVESHALGRRAGGLDLRLQLRSALRRLPGWLESICRDALIPRHG